MDLREFCKVLVGFGLRSDNYKIKLLTTYLVWWFKHRYEDRNVIINSGNLKLLFKRAILDLKKDEIRCQVRFKHLESTELNNLLEIDLEKSIAQLKRQFKEETSEFFAFEDATK